MESNIVTAIFLPVALGVVMLGLGITLTIEDFKRVLLYPKAAIVGLSAQMLIMPFICFGIAKAFSLPGELAVGLMLLAASPGGATANLFSHLSKGDVALNISLTAINSVLTLFTLPFIVNLSLIYFMGEGKVIPLQFSKVMQIFFIVLGPVAIGMIIRNKYQLFAKSMEKPVKILSALFLILMVAGTIYNERLNFINFFILVGLPALSFNVISMLAGFYIPRILGLGKKQCISIGMEIGVHNGVLAMAIASSPLLLNNSTMAIPPAIYSLIMLFTAAGFGFIVQYFSSEN